MEQTQRTCEVLTKPGSGFYDVETIELVRRSYNVKRIFVPVADIGLGNEDFKRAIVSTETEEKVLPCAYETSDDLPLGDVVVRTTPDPGAGEKGFKNKRLKNELSNAKTEVVEKGRTLPAATKYAFACRTCVTPKEIYGHTGYLTFASYCPDVCILDNES